MVAGHDVEEWFSLFGSNEDWGRRQGCFEALQSLLSFLSPDESVCLFEKLVERHPPFVELGDESAQGGQTAGEPLYALDIAYRAHVGDGHDFLGLASMPHSDTIYPCSFPFEIPKTHFSGFNLMLNLRRFVNVAAKLAIRSQA